MSTTLPDIAPQWRQLLPRITAVTGSGVPTVTKPVMVIVKPTGPNEIIDLNLYTPTTGVDSDGLGYIQWSLDYFFPTKGRWKIYAYSKAPADKVNLHFAEVIDLFDPTDTPDT